MGFISGQYHNISLVTNRMVEFKIENKNFNKKNFFLIFSKFIFSFLFFFYLLKVLFYRKSKILSIYIFYIQNININQTKIFDHNITNTPENILEQLEKSSNIISKN
jgi:hypothetical protein